MGNGSAVLGLVWDMCRGERQCRGLECGTRAGARGWASCRGCDRSRRGRRGAGTFRKGFRLPEGRCTGRAGRLEGRFHQSATRGAPIAIILHPHPQFGGTMNNQIVYHLYYAFAERGFSVLRFNFRGVGRSQGSFDHGSGELSDAAAALDWAQAVNPEARACCIAGLSFGPWLRLQPLRPLPHVERLTPTPPPAHRRQTVSTCPPGGPAPPRASSCTATRTASGRSRK